MFELVDSGALDLVYYIFIVSPDERWWWLGGGRDWLFVQQVKIRE